MTLEQPILVGVTGRDENTDALRFAADEATLRRCGVVLAHVVPSHLPLVPTGFPVDDVPWLETGNTVVEGVRAEFETLAGRGVRVVTDLRQGRAGDTLARLSESAALVVVQHRDLSRMRQAVSGSTSSAVAARAHCPVVSVPHAEDPGPRHLLSVGVHEDGGPPAALEAAFSEASLRGLPVRVVYAWRLAPAYDVLFPATSWSHQMEATLHAAVHELSRKYPDVAVAVDVRHDYPAEALVAASRASELLVLGRHRQGRAQPHRLGSLTRTVMAHGACPVMVVPV
jgi:nucleotide-binding universal stress UspA family protein